MYEGVVQDLIDELGRLPGVGPKSAQRIAFHMLNSDRDEMRKLVSAITEVLDKVTFCVVCGNVSSDEQCRICRDPRRDQTVLCIVEEPKDVVAIEKTREFRGRYHILGGAISPLDGVGPDELRVKELVTRLASGEVTEIILATDPNLEGEATATYLARLLKPMGLRVTRLASGLPVGGDLEYADELTLGRAFEGGDCWMSDFRDHEGGWGDPQDGSQNRPQVHFGDSRVPSARRSASIDLTDDRAAEAMELHQLAEETATDAQTYLDAVTEVAAGSAPDTAIPVLLLALSQTLLAGARLGAITDIVPSERFEPDAGPDPDIDPVRTGLANLLDGLDEYADIVDPLTSGELVRGILSDDLADVAADLAHGLRHFQAGRIDEALWWFQFSYLSTWGVRATSALRVLQSMLGHLRLDVDADTAADAQFEALHLD